MNLAYACAADSALHCQSISTFSKLKCSRQINFEPPPTGAGASNGLGHNLGFALRGADSASCYKSISTLKKCKCSKAARQCSALQRGVDSAANHIFRLNEHFEMCSISKLICSIGNASDGFSQGCGKAAARGRAVWGRQQKALTVQPRKGVKF